MDEPAREGPEMTALAVPGRSCRRPGLAEGGGTRAERREASARMAHVLVVDDEFIIAMVFRKAIEELGHRVTLALDGCAALAADDRDPVDILVTDLRMPAMDGTELLRRLRERRPGLPAVVVSGYTADLGEAGSAAATVVLSKPVSPHLLASHVATLLEGRAETGIDPTS
jgi:CheY-like chemotaxis protein